jgi:tRNA (guanine-N7-)-methyltransferase
MTSPTTAASSEAAAGAPAVEIPPGSVRGPFDFAALFGNRNPVEIEVGSGKGRFLIDQATARPEVNFLGIEWSVKYLRVAAERAARRGLRNVRLYRADARHVIADLVPDASIVRLHVYCPDPWPKKRHHKRRFFGPAILVPIARVLAPGGRLHVSTDVADYFAEILAALGSQEALRPAVDPLLGVPATAGRTSYEIKYVAAGRTIQRTCWGRPG